MTSRNWNGVGDYDVFLEFSEQEMKALTDFYNVDWSFFTTGPSKTFDGKYFCFASYSRRKLALLPFLSLAFGGMYDILPLGNECKPEMLDFTEFTLEEFSFRTRQG